LISLQALNGLRVREAAGAGIGHLCLERGHRTLTIKLVRRATDQAGQRRNIMITAAGRPSCYGLTPGWPASDELLAPQSPGERQALTGMLIRLLHHHASPPTPTPCRPARTPLTDRSQPTLCPHVAADLALI